MREQLGVMLSATINLISDSSGHQGAVTADFGVNKVPTLEDVQVSINNAIAFFNESLGVTDARLTNMGDFGFAEPRSMQWPPVQEIANPIDDPDFDTEA